MLSKRIQERIFAAYNSSEPRFVEEDYILLSSGRVVKIEREDYCFSFDEFDHLGTIDFLDDDEADKFETVAEGVNITGGAALPVYYYEGSGTLSPYPLIGEAPSRRGVIHVEKDKLYKEKIARLNALCILAKEAQEWNACNNVISYCAALYQTAEDYLRHDPLDSIGGLMFYGDDRVSDGLKYHFDLTPEEVEEIRAKFDSSL